MAQTLSEKVNKTVTLSWQYNTMKKFLLELHLYVATYVGHGKNLSYKKHNSSGNTNTNLAYKQSTLALFA